MAWKRLFWLARGQLRLLMLALLVAAITWGVGLLLASDLNELLTSREWQYQPIYLAAHIVAAQLFVRAYKVNFSAGISHLDIEPGPAQELKRAVMPLGYLIAAAVAAPFAIADYHYLYSVPFGGGAPRATDLVIWLIWCAEWYLSALMWVVLVTFLTKNARVIRRYNFKSPVEVVVYEAQYRPFLRMAVQGASILLFLRSVTVAYVWYTGGEFTDYMALMITFILVIIGFIVPWQLLTAKIDRALANRIGEMTLQLTREPQRLQSTQHTEDELSRERLRDLDIGEILLTLRILLLRQERGSIGQREAASIAIRSAPFAITIAWHMRQYYALLF